MAKKKEKEEKEEKKDKEEKEKKKSSKKKDTKKKDTKKKSSKKKDTKKKKSKKKSSEKKESTKKKKSSKKKDTKKKKSSKESVKDEVFELIKTMSVVELYELVKELEEEFEVSAQASVVAPTTGAPAEDAEEKVEKKSFDPVLTKIGDAKLQVIKVVRQLTKIGLKEAKALVDSAPSPIKEDVPKDEAEDIKKKLEEVGATVELK